MCQRGLVAEDLFRIALVGQTTLHPSGRHAISEITHLDPDTNQGASHLWHIDTNGGDKSPFTWGEGSQQQPQYSPNGRFVAFLQSKNGEPAQVCVMRSDGGEAIAVTKAAHGVMSFIWHPNGNALLCQGRMEPKAVLPDTPRARFTKDVRVIERTFYRLDGVGFFGESRVHLFAVNIAALTQHRAFASEAVAHWAFPTVRVTQGEFDVGAYAFSPDGSRIALVSNLKADADETQHRFVYETNYPGFADAHATPKMPQRLKMELSYVENIAYSPSGRYLAVLGHHREAGQYTLCSLYLFDRETEALQNLSEQLDLSFGNAMLSDVRANVSVPLIWSEDGQFIYTIVSSQGRAQIVSLHIAQGQLKWLTQGRHTVLSFDLSQDRGTAVLLIETATSPANLYVQNIPLSGEGMTTPRALTDLNRTLFTEAEVITPKHVRIGEEEKQVEGWLILPSSPPPAEGYPVVVQVHGGPVAAYGESFFLEFQLIAAEGVAVLYCNPRGSLGYGQAYAEAIRGRWGTDDFQDIERFVDGACAAFPLNAANMAIAGGSYGGFMAAWAISHSSRYKAAVVMRACVNEYSMFGTCDVGFTDVEDLQVAPWQDPARYARLSPLAFADNMKASVLVIHAENDLRCPVEQAEQFYAALRYHQVPVRMIRFPDESHDLSRSGQPWHRVVRLEYIVAFLQNQLVV